MSNGKRRPDGVTIIALWYMVLASGAAFGACATAIPASLLSLSHDVPTGGRFVATVLLGFGLGVAVVIAVALGVISWGLWKLRPWARLAAMLAAVLHLPFFPAGTAIGVATLWYLSSHEQALTPFADRQTVAP